MPEIVGPHFFSRVFKEEGDKGGGCQPDAAPREEYWVELSATGLSMKDNLDFLPILGADRVVLGISGSYNPDDDQREKVGSASVSITDAHFQTMKRSFISCTIEQLDVNTGDTLTDMQAFAAILRQIQSLCIDYDAEHLVMIGSESFRVSSTLIEHVGFTLCDCEHPSKDVSVGSQSRLCMALPTGPSRSLVRKDQEHPIYSSSSREKEQVATLGNRTPASRTTNNGAPFETKTYCMFWIMKGQCAYMQTGCKYKHEIPLDKETRKKIGLAEIPQWFKESSHWGPWLKQADYAKRLERTSNRHDNAFFLAQPLGGPSDPRATSVSSRGDGKATRKRRRPANFDSYMLEYPHRNPIQEAVASNFMAEASRQIKRPRLLEPPVRVKTEERSLRNLLQ